MDDEKVDGKRKPTRITESTKSLGFHLDETTCDNSADNRHRAWEISLDIAGRRGIAQSLQSASTKDMGDHLAWPSILFISAIVGPIKGVLALYLGSALIRWTGRWFGGQAPYQHIRAATAWAGE